MPGAAPGRDGADTGASSAAPVPIGNADVDRVRGEVAAAPTDAGTYTERLTLLYLWARLLIGLGAEDAMAPLLGIVTGLGTKEPTGESFRAVDDGFALLDTITAGLPAALLPGDVHADRDGRRDGKGSADVLPTLCELAGIPAPADVQGRSIVPAVRADAATEGGHVPHPVMVTCYYGDPRFHNFSLYDARFRYTWYPATGERELYDHGDDPHELHNRAEDPTLREHVGRLHATLLEAHVGNDAQTLGRVAVW